MIKENPNIKKPKDECFPHKYFTLSVQVKPKFLEAARQKLPAPTIRLMEKSEIII